MDKPWKSDILKMKIFQTENFNSYTSTIRLLFTDNFLTVQITWSLHFNACHKKSEQRKNEKIYHVVNEFDWLI